ncbi:hypothetical protein QO002_000105 [Pararhizobium capsulatum DSM 1112]|uniref:Uncharacterized protein n=1 Tax=Pararhizobium capsulatum DSM 1112 TaxID=1121113 RepID=A0ABU0BI82_9HYPH|nr:hypothetical protein [Pararhizobium capsulatum]MDQ0317967.1 hypothetical protein [Pararhizobium capsulatum DSM 1112]
MITLIRLIRLGFSVRFDDIRDHLSEKTMQVFRGSKIDAMPRRNVDDRLILPVDDRLSEAQIDNVVVMAQLGKHVDIGNGHPIVSYLPQVVTDSQRSSGLHDNFVLRHQASPFVQRIGDRSPAGLYVATIGIQKGWVKTQPSVSIRSQYIRGLHIICWES